MNGTNIHTWTPELRAKILHDRFSSIDESCVRAADTDPGGWLVLNAMRDAARKRLEEAELEARIAWARAQAPSQP